MMIVVIAATHLASENQFMNARRCHTHVTRGIALIFHLLIQYYPATNRRTDSSRQEKRQDKSETFTL